MVRLKIRKSVTIKRDRFDDLDRELANLRILLASFLYIIQLIN
ncbi:hypothetical protein MYAER_3932 [Microcystis aeruginosa NIES-2549]|uniref:Uncharacterized protein n=1 Tax=Microcystis aeruginosa NIES-2549 TaxID=1641812 RepID=A0A0F6RNC3_MICAE|nr:hypothetical protein MYAER_3932 [Microcystis aeruginosa NIES-2549]